MPKPLRACLLALVLALPGLPALGHSKVTGTTPPDGAVLEALPEAIDFTFASGMRLTRVVQTGPDAQPVDLDISGQAGFVTDLSLPLAEAGAGRYRIDWRGLSQDGHALQGVVTFDVK